VARCTELERGGATTKISHFKNAFWFAVALALTLAVLRANGLSHGEIDLRESVITSLRRIVFCVESVNCFLLADAFAAEPETLYCAVPNPEEIEGRGGREAWGIGDIDPATGTVVALVVYITYPEDGPDTTLPNYYEDFEMDFQAYWDFMSLGAHQVFTSTYIRPDSSQAACAMVARKRASEYGGCDEVNNEILTRIFCADPAESCNTQVERDSAETRASLYDVFIMVHDRCAAGGCGGGPICPLGESELRGKPSWVHGTGMTLHLLPGYGAGWRSLVGQTDVAAHEYGHLLGLWHSIQGLGELGHYSLMCSTGLRDSAARPIHVMDLVKLGWVDTVTVNTSQTLRIRDIRIGGKAYSIPIKSPEEYFLLCNHQQTEFDSIYLNSGLLIWHIRGTKWDLECASGLWRDICLETKVADPISGVDTLTSMGGGGCHNYGSQTDFFDGVSKTEFSFREGSNPNTNGYVRNQQGIYVQPLYTGIAVDSIAQVSDTLGTNAMYCVITPESKVTATVNSKFIIGCPGWDGDSLIVYVTVLDGYGNAVPNIPPDSVYALFPNYCYNNGKAFADSVTNSQGKTTISMLQLGHGCYYPPDSVEVGVYVRGEKVRNCPRIWFLTYDLVGDDCRVTSADNVEMLSEYVDGNCCIDYHHDDLCGHWGEHGGDTDVADRNSFLVHMHHPIEVISPNGDSVWAAGSQHQISWVDSDGNRNTSHVTLVLSKDGGSTFADTIAKDETNDGSYTWTIPADAESLGTYRVKAIVYDNAGGYMAHSAADTSDSNFTITWGTPSCGTISSNTTWSGSVYVPCDVVVGSNFQLTVSPGCLVRFARSDSSHSGIDTTKCELIVQGTLVADGSEQSKPTFSSATSSPAAGDWRGIRLRPGNSNNLIDNCIIKYAYTGIDACSTTVTVDSCTVSSFSNDGIKAVASTVTLTRDSLLVASTGVRGIELTSATSGTVDHNTITGSSSGVRYGIEVKDYTDPDIRYNWIDGLKYGIKCTGGSPTLLHNRVQGSTGNGIQCAGDALPTIRYTTIENFQGTGVTAIDYSIPDLGAYPDSGSNRIYTSQSLSYYVANVAQDQISALYNWWGTKTPNSKKFYGDVDYLPCDTLDPGTSYALPLLPVVSPAPGAPYAMQSYPNPFNPRTTIEYGVSEPWAHVKILVYDIFGRVVKVLVDKPQPAGHSSVIWDGRNERGEIVASGVYFYEVTIGDFRQAKKFVVLK
jgi:hypothetical protein